MSSMGDMKEALEQFDNEWTAAQANAKSGGAILDAGDYQARITVSRVENNDWGDLTFTTRFEDIVSGVGVNQYDNLNHEVGRSIAAERTKALGYEGLASELPEACETGFFLGLVCDIRVKDKPAKDDPARIYKQVWVNKLHGKLGEEQTAMAALPADDSDIPF